MFANEPQWVARDAFKRKFHVWSSVGDLEQWRSFGETSAVFIVDYAEVKGFAGQIPDLDARMRHRAFAHVMPYRQHSRLLVLAGRDERALLDLIDRVAALPALPATGVVATID